MRVAVLSLLLLTGIVHGAAADLLEETANLKSLGERPRADILQLAEAGDARAQFEMFMRTPPEGGKQDWLDAAYRSATPPVRAAMALELTENHRCEEAFRWLQQGHDEGQRDATVGLGKLRLTNRCGDLYIPKEGLRLLEEALKAGAGEAAVYLGEVYVHGTAVYVTRDQDRALAYFRQAETLGVAKQPFAERLYWMAYLYLWGGEMPRNVKRGRLYHEWAERLNPTGKNNLWVLPVLAHMHFLGIGVPQDTAKGYGYLVRAYEISGDSAEAQALAVAYSNPSNAPPDYAEAHRWYLKCAVDNKSCRVSLGRLFADEKAEQKGLRRDLVEAYKWLLLCGVERQGKDIQEWMQTIESKLSPAEIVDGKQRAEAWARTNDGLANSNRDVAQ